MKTFAPALLAVFAAAAFAADPVRLIPGWGMVTDPDADCTVTAEAGQLVLSIPGKDHALAIEAQRMNAPRILQDTEGDFSVQVKVTVDFPAHTVTEVPGRRAFQGAGLLLWVDRENYLRLERSQLVVGRTDPANPGGASASHSYVSFETRAQGRPVRLGNTAEHPIGGLATFLKLERRGEEITASASADGLQWQPVGATTLKGPRNVQVGIVAGHNTTSALKATFEDLKITPLLPAAKP